MNIPSNHPNILHLEGITLDNFFSDPQLAPIEPTVSKKVVEVVKKNKQPIATYNKIPTVFTSIEEWPLSTNLQCWSCSLTFDGPPCFAPSFIRYGNNTHFEAGVKGNFCTFNCAARYIDDIFIDKKWKMRDNLLVIYYYFKGAKVQYIKPSPRKTELIVYGGALSKEEFVESIHKLDPINELEEYHHTNNITKSKDVDVLQFQHKVWDVCVNMHTELPASSMAESAAVAATNTDKDLEFLFK